jgi:hypothetical protein
VFLQNVYSWELKGTVVASKGKISNQVQPKVSVQKWKCRGGVEWAVYRRENGKPMRTFFASKSEAETEVPALPAHAGFLLCLFPQFEQ